MAATCHLVARAPRDLLRAIPGTAGRPSERMCLGCGKLFTDKSNARRHVRRMHLVREGINLNEQNELRIQLTVRDGGNPTVVYI